MALWVTLRDADPGPPPTADEAPSADAAPARALGVALQWPPPDDPRTRAILVGRVSSITPEVAMKMGVLQPREGRFDFAAADGLVALAERDGLAVRGHTLVWYKHLPAWLAGRGWSREELVEVLRAHVRAVVGHYRGRVAEWDVVNEPLDGGGRLRESIWMRAIGPEYIDIALAAARQADPGARLMINEYGVEGPGPKRDALLSLVASLRRRGVPLDGVGLQGHVRTDDHPTREQLDETIRAFAGLGASVSISELDVAERPPPARPAAEDAAQARVYAIFGGACAASPACRGVTVWGLSDADSWLGPEARALPFDADRLPKPAWTALVAALDGG
jgi:endo-1,4-beta-xylanase